MPDQTPKQQRSLEQLSQNPEKVAEFVQKMKNDPELIPVLEKWLGKGVPQMLLQQFDQALAQQGGAQ